MRAIKRSIEMQRQIEEAEKEIQRKKEEEQKNEEIKKADSVKEREQQKPAADVIAEKGKAFFEIYGFYLAVLAVVMAISLIGAYFVIETGFSFFGAVSHVWTDGLVGVLLVFAGVLVPIGLIHLLHALMAEKTYSKLAWIIPDAVSFFITVVFLFCV